MENFDDLFEEFLNDENNDKGKDKKGDSKFPSSEDEMDEFMEELNDFEDGTSKTNPEDRLGEPDEIQERKEKGLLFIRRIWHTPDGDIIRGEVRIDGKMDPSKFRGYNFEDMMKNFMGDYMEAPPYPGMEGRMRRPSYDEMMSKRYGKHPKTNSKLNLKQQLKFALEIEDYERAAKLRDRIKKENEKNKSSEKPDTTGDTEDKQWGF